MKKYHYILIFISLLAFVTSKALTKSNAETNTNTKAVKPFLAGRYYIMVTRKSKLCANVARYRRRNNAKIIQLACNGRANQSWLLLKWSDNSYTFMSKATSDVIEAPDSIVGGSLVLSSFSGSPSQRWFLQGQSPPGQWAFINVTSGLCMDINGGNNTFIQTTCDFGGNQLFSLILIADILLF